MTKNIALVGLGPHAKRIYLNYFKKYKINLSLVVDLKSQKENVKSYLKEHSFENANFFEIKDEYKDYEHLPKEISNDLLEVCKEMNITHIIISTEPKAHNMYIEFALKNNIHVLTDKPITVNKDMTNISSIKKTRKQYYDILDLATKSKAMCKVMCQRQYHRGYEYIKDLLNNVVSEYQIPITYIDIYHCDGNWEMPHDLLKENHPYKYGYGKLFHSGYHFIDLLSDFLKINNQLSQNKKIMNGEIYTNCFTPNDELGVCDINDYKRLFKNQNIPEYYNNIVNPDFYKFGEKNFYSLMKFTNMNQQTITSVNMNLLHYGFSRRGWIESKDYYKSNGRIRHERINIQVGTLLNIQVHSYQSKEIKDRLHSINEEEIGGLEHYDIDIYRNTDIIGGKPYEKIKLGNLYTEKEKENILGYNELSREEYLTNFLNGKCDKGDIRDQALAIEILYSCALGIHNHYSNNEHSEKINIRNDYTYPLKIKELKQYSHIIESDKKTDLINTHFEYKDIFEIGVMLNKIINTNRYETYLYISSEDEIASMLLYKKFNNIIFAKLYFGILSVFVKYKDINKIAKVIAKKYKS